MQHQAIVIAESGWVIVSTIINNFQSAVMKLYKCVVHRITLKAEFEDGCAHICLKTQMIVSQCGSLPPALRHQAKLEDRAQDFCSTEQLMFFNETCPWEKRPGPWLLQTRGASLKGQFMFFEVGSYKVHIYSRSVPYHYHRSAKFNHLKQGSPRKIYHSSSVRCTENSQHFTLPSDRPFFWHYLFLTVEPLYPYTLVQLGNRWSVSGKIQCKAQLLDERFYFW